MKHLIKNLFLSPDEEAGGGYAEDLDSILGDPVGDLEADTEDSVVEGGDSPQSVAQMTMEDALRMVQSAGMQVVRPEDMTQQAQAEHARQQSTFEIAQQVQVPPEIAEQGLDQELMYRMAVANEIATQQRMAPILAERAAAKIASDLNAPGLQDVVNTELTNIVGPQWYALANDESGKGALSLMIEGIVARNAGKMTQNKKRVPTPEIPGRQSPVQPNVDAGLAARLDQMFGAGVGAEILEGL